MYKYIYKITLTKGSLKDKIYIGKHTTNNLDDGYKGSGVIVNKYYKKYPNDYIKEIICYCDTDNELNNKEKELIDYYRQFDNCLNIHPGGKGGSYYQTKETREKNFKDTIRKKYTCIF